MTSENDRSTSTLSPHVLVPAGGGRQLMDRALGAILLAGARDTAGAAAFVVHPLAPRTLGSPVHTHTLEDEWTYVLAGQVGVEVGGEVVLAAPGDLVLKPRGVPHAFWNPTDEPARVLEVITPGGFERYFEELGEILAAPDPDLGRLVEIAARYGLRMEPESIPRLVTAYGLQVP